MSNTKPTNEENGQEISPEEIAQREKMLIDFYEKQSAVLEKQKKYLELLTEIDELNFRRLRAQIAFGQLAAGPSEEDQTSAPEGVSTEVAKEGKSVRKLKTTTNA